MSKPKNYTEACEIAIKVLKEDILEERTAHEKTMIERDNAEEMLDKITSAILDEPIDWQFHDKKWQEALEESQSLSHTPILMQQLRARVTELESNLVAAHKENSDLKESLSKWREATGYFSPVVAKVGVKALRLRSLEYSQQDNAIINVLDRTFSEDLMPNETPTLKRVKEFVKAVDEQMEIIEKSSNIDNIRSQMAPHIANLRHLYMNMVRGHAKNINMIADGLLSPAIAGIERVITHKDKKSESKL